MDLVFELTKEHPDIAVEEVLCVVKPKESESVNRLLIGTAEYDENKIKRLAYTKSVHQLFFSCKISELQEKLSTFNWNSIYKSDFSITVEDPDKQLPSEATLAGYIWRSVTQPKVSLTNSRTPIHLFVVEDTVWCTRLLVTLHDKYESRKAHRLAFFHSGALNPRLAKGVINLLGSTLSDTIVDPCCGGGGLLIEAGLQGIPIIGYDINERMVWGCMQNLELFNLSGNISLGDATHLHKPIDYLVCDLPYGLNSVAFHSQQINLKRKDSTPQKLDEFYQAFLASVKRVLKKKAILIFPHFVPYRKLIDQTGLRREKEFSIYIHKSLTRKIVRITPKG